MPIITDPAFGVYGWRRDPPWDMGKPRPGKTFLEEAMERRNFGVSTYAGMPAYGGGGRLAGYYGDARSHIAGTAGSYGGRPTSALARNAGLSGRGLGQVGTPWHEQWWGRVAIGVGVALIALNLWQGDTDDGHGDYDDEQD